jgi:hypothetical protein
MSMRERTIKNDADLIDRVLKGVLNGNVPVWSRETKNG